MPVVIALPHHSGITEAEADQAIVAMISLRVRDLLREIMATAGGIVLASERAAVDLSDVTIARELRHLDTSIEQLTKLRQSLQYRTEALQSQRAKTTSADADPFADPLTRSA